MSTTTFADFKKGSFVVHDHHGIAIFQGIVKRALGNILLSLGHSYFDIGKLDESLEFFSKGLKLAKKTKIKENISIKRRV